jgi:pteridine reductase
MDTHLHGHLALIGHCAQALRKNTGAIVAITDIAVDRPEKGYVSYLAAKGALAAAMRALSIELAPDVRVNTVAPGALEWPENAPFSDERKSRIIAGTPLARTGTFFELAAAVEFLLFDATFTTGVTLPVDGGRMNYLES